ncbi:MAG: ATP-binding protein, partial [Myxococcota bacterium]
RREVLLSQIQRTQSIQREHSELLERLPVAILSTEDGQIVEANPQVYKLFGELESKAVEDLLGALPEAERWEKRLEIQGEQRWISAFRGPLEGGGEVFILEDITRLREMEAQIEREERLAAVGRLAASLAHEIRNPLTSLSGSVQLLQEGKDNPLLRIILREVNRLNELVEDFLQSARPLTLTFELVELDQMVQEVVLIFQNDNAWRNSRTFNTAIEEIEPINLDPDRFRQVLWNLLRNAAQATSAGSQIDVALRARDEVAELVVRDDGVGIPPDRLLRIFDPFFTTRSGGTGLGLANVDRIVRGHNGTIKVDSVVGEGTSFTIRLPYGESRSEPQSQTVG